MKRKQHFLKILSTISMLVIMAPALAACSGSLLASQLADKKLTICHATGNALNPYDEVTLSLNELISHANHKNDIVPAPVGGCPKIAQAGNNNGQIAICHATSDTNNPYTQITVDFNGLLEHVNHQGDIIPAPVSGCAAAAPNSTVTGTVSATGTPGGTPATATLTATPTLAITLSATPTVTPGLTATSTATANGTQAGMITICHATGSKKNPYVMITISINGLNGHNKHARDIIPAPAGGCPR
jgi:hypothetical protein